MGKEKYCEWEEMALPELKAYLGIFILMGIVRLPAIEDYWKRDPFLHFPPIVSRIPRQCFHDMSQFLHFVDNTTLVPRGQPGYDKLDKVHPIITHCSSIFLSSCNPHYECAIDEAMIPFQGRSTLKQYLPLKPIKRGIKVWVRADSHNGYFSQFDIYTGKGSNTSPELGLGGSVVRLLTCPIVGKFHQVFMDSSSPVRLSSMTCSRMISMPVEQSAPTEEVFHRTSKERD